MKPKKKQPNNHSNKIDDPENFRHWTWYLFLFSNLAIIVGIAISWALWKNITTDNTSPIIYGVPIIVFNVISLIGLFIFYYFDYKEINYIRMHVRKKWFKWYFVCIFTYLINIIFVIIFYALKDKINLENSAFFGILFGISSFLTLGNVGFYKFVRFKIDYDLYLRRKGEQEKRKKSKKIDPIKITSDLKSHASK